MTVVIKSDDDMPECLDSRFKQMKKAASIVNAHVRGDPVRRVSGAEPQGNHSRTFFVTTQSGACVVIQFRLERLDIKPFQIAQNVLGSVVPEIREVPEHQLQQEGVWVYWMHRVHGEAWSKSVVGSYKEAPVSILRSLGKIFAKALFTGDTTSKQVIDHSIRPHLKLIIASEDPQISQFRPIAKELLIKLPKLEALPLFISHFDLSDDNILVDYNVQVSGIVDWEHSTPLPFGMGFARIHTLAGRYLDQKFIMSEKFIDADEVFWRNVWNNLPFGLGDMWKDDVQAVQAAVTLGTLLDAFQLEDGKIGPYNRVVVESLPKLLTYRISLLRPVNSSPYCD